MRVLFISYDGMTDPLGQSQVLPYLCGLSQKGAAITLISCEKPERYEQGKAVIAEICATHNIRWEPVAYTKSPPVLSTIKDVRTISKKAFALHNETPFDIVHCRSYISALVGQQLKKKKGVRFIFDMRGFWADERVDGQVWNLKNPLFKTVYNYFKKKEKQFLIEADHTISLTHNACPVLMEWAQKPIPVTVIPCCANLDLFNYQKIETGVRENTRKALGIAEDALVFCYLGSIGTWYMAKEMMRLFEHTTRTYKNAVFLIITQDAPEPIKTLAASEGIGADRIVIKPASRNEVPALLSASDISMFFILPVFSKKASSPTKQGEIMGMGLPLICNAGVGDVDKIMQQSPGAGHVMKGFNQNDYQEAVETIPTLLKADKAAIRQAAFAFYDLEAGIKKYYEVYKGLENTSVQ